MLAELVKCLLKTATPTSTPATRRKVASLRPANSISPQLAMMLARCEVIRE